MRLTEEQKKIVEENHNLIYWYINKNKLDVNDYYDLLAIELCNTAMKHNAERGSFANYFNLRADGMMYKEYRKANAHKRKHVEVDFDVDYYNTMGDIDITDGLALEELMSGEYGEVLLLKSKGYTQVEIADILNTNQSKVSKILKRAKDEYEGKVDKYGSY